MTKKRKPGFIFPKLTFSCFIYLLFNIVCVTGVPTYTISVLVSTSDDRRIVDEVVPTVNQFLQRTNAGVEIAAVPAIVSGDNPIRFVEHMCEVMSRQPPHAAIVALQPDDEIVTATASFTFGFYKIPVVSTTARQNVFSDKVFFFNTFSHIFIVVCSLHDELHRGLKVLTFEIY